MNQISKKQKPAVSDNYKGLKKESAVIIIKEKNGKVTKIKI
jgi:hypothetical protein